VSVPTESALKRELIWLGVSGSAALCGGGVLLGLYWQPERALQWLAQTLLIWLFLLYQAWLRLPLNRPAVDAPLYSDLGWGNRLTLLRACLIAATGGFLLQPWPEGRWLAWVPGWVYFFGAIFDRVDGYVARRCNHSSLLGNDLDNVSDALGLAVVSLLAYGYGQIHWSYLLFGAAYYLFHGGLMWRRYQGLPIYPLPPYMHRRAWAGFQMGFLVVAIWPWFYPPTTTLAGFAFMVPVLIGFAVDWLFVSGRLDPEAPTVQARLRKLVAFSALYLQPLMRLLILGLLLESLRRNGFEPGWFMLWGFVVATAMIVLGVAGRAACLAMIGLVASYYAEITMTTIEAVLYCCIVWMMLLGTGRFSLWQPDQAWLHRYDGA